MLLRASCATCTSQASWGYSTNMECTWKGLQTSISRSLLAGCPPCTASMRKLLALLMNPLDIATSIKNADASPV